MDLLLTAAELSGAGLANLDTVRGLIGVVLGVGALIFFHEAGHFLAAKWRGVRVEVFSLGFGHRLFGFKRGGTDYRISALPLGGYVRMLGQADEDPTQPRTELEDDFRNKKVWERFVILFAGPFANVVLAAVGFIACFGLGVNFTAPEVGMIMPGSAAAKADLRRGDVVTHIDDKELLGWQDLQTLVALADGPIELRVVRDGKVHHTVATPFRGPNDSYARLGVSPALVIHDFTEDSPLPAAGVQKASPGSRDRLLNIAPLTSSWAPSDKALTDRELSRVLEKAEGDVGITIERTRYDIESGLPIKRELVPIEIDLERKAEWSLGLDIPDHAYVREVRPGSAADRAGVEPGDRILELGGKEVLHSNLREVVKDTGARLDRTSLVVERDGERVELEVELELQNKEIVEKALEGVESEEKQLEIKRAWGNWLLGVVYHADVLGSAGALPLADEDDEPIELQAGDRIKSIWTDGGLWWSAEMPFGSDRAVRGWLRSRKDEPFKISWIPKGSIEEKSAVVRARKDDSKTYADLGLIFTTRKVKVQRGPLDAVVLGMEQTVIQTKRIFMMVGSFATGAVSPKELGGPIQIVNVAYTFAAKDTFARLLHLLAILSVNLAVINILPIPVLDGGHIFFLMLEKLKGRPLSSEILIYSQWFGLFCILGLMALVFFNDIRRLME